MTVFQKRFSGFFICLFFVCCFPLAVLAKPTCILATNEGTKIELEAQKIIKEKFADKVDFRTQKDGEIYDLLFYVKEVKGNFQDSLNVNQEKLSGLRSRVNNAVYLILGDKERLFSANQIFFPSHYLTRISFKETDFGIMIRFDKDKYLNVGTNDLAFKHVADYIKEIDVKGDASGAVSRLTKEVANLKKDVSAIKAKLGL